MIAKEDLKKYAAKLMFDMKEEEYETLQNEFEIMLKHMEVIDKIEGLKDVSPMTFPFDYENVEAREDFINQELTTEDVLFNADNSYLDQVRVPKVVE